MPDQNGTRPVYRRTPFIDLVCQVQFPPVLKISQAPTGFQDRIRRHFPLFEVAPDNRGYQFITEDRSCHLVLTPSSLALVAQRDLGWTSFRSSFLQAFQALQQEFAPTLYSRLGLRSRNLFCRSACNLTGKAWDELFRVPVVNMAPFSALQGEVQANRSEVLLALQGGSVKARLSHGPVVAQLSGQVVATEACYLLDSDVFVEDRLDAANALALLDRLNQEAVVLFRWCITDALHQALEPQAA